jgi:hypothetical protein
LKDNLERSKYDEDNPYHGIDRAQAQRTAATGARSGTAKRYTASTTSHQPGWANGGAASRGAYDSGFAQQAGASRSKAWGGYGSYEESWDQKTPSGYSYQTHRTTRPATTADFEDPYDSYRKRDSAYGRTSGAHPTAPKYYNSAPNASATPRPKSTTGTNARYTANATPSATPAGFNIADYIRDAKAREAREEAEKRKQEADELKAKEQARLRREAEEEQKRAEEERAERHRKAREEREREQQRRRAEEAVRNSYADTNGYGGRSTPTPNGYGYQYSNETPSPYSSRKAEEDLLREADEKMRERGKAPKPQPHLGTQSRRTSRASMNPKPDGANWSKNHPLYETHGKPENWKSDKSYLQEDDIEVVEATPTTAEEPSKPNGGAQTDYFTETAPQTGPEYVRKDGTGVYPVPPSLFNFKAPVREKTPPAKTGYTMPGSYNMGGSWPAKAQKESSLSAEQDHGSGEETEPDEGNVEEAKKATGKSQDSYGPSGPPPVRPFSPPAKTDAPSGSKPSVNVFTFEEKPATPAKEDRKTPFSNKFDFAFASQPVNNFSSESPELRGGKAASTGSAPHLRPQSQPTHSQPHFAPPPSAPPNLQQQQQHRANNGGTSGFDNMASEFKKTLYEDLLKQAAFSASFDPQPSSASTGSTARRKKSVPSLKRMGSRAMHRTGSGRPIPGNPPKAAESETETDEPKSANTEKAAAGFGFEPMDAEPTGAPKTIPTNTTASRPTPPLANLANGVGRPSEKKAKVEGSSLDMSGLGAVPPLSRSPADVGLGSFESLKETLPFPSQAETKLQTPIGFNPLRMRNSMGSLKINDPFNFGNTPDLWSSFTLTPSEPPLVLPKPPGIPQLPRETSLDKYNRFYNSLGKYVEDWNRYESEVHNLRAELTRRTLRGSTTELLDTQDIVKYMDRVKSRDMVLDAAFSKARSRHLDALEKWVKLRKDVLKVMHQEQRD